MADIAIIGGGIGGLTAAIALRQYGFEAVVFERAPSLLDLGAAIALWPNATRALSHLGIAESVLTHAGTISEIRWLTHEGRTLNSVHIANPTAPAAALHRADLQRVLIHSLPTSVIKLDHSFSRHHLETESITVSFRNSGSLHCHYLIGADGIHSTVSKEISDHNSPIFRGYIVWRGISTAKPQQIPDGVALELHGYGRRFGIGPVGNGRIGWWAAANTAVESPIEGEGHADAHGELLELFEDWYRPLSELIQSTESILRTEACDRLSSAAWGRGPVTLLGDAIHPTTPNLGQGGCMAIEDAVVLARCLRKYGLSESALRAYERVRHLRTAAVTYASRVYGQVGQFENPLTSNVRSRLISVTPRFAIKQLMRVVFDYDAAEVRI